MRAWTLFIIVKVKSKKYFLKGQSRVTFLTPELITCSRELYNLLQVNMHIAKGKEEKEKRLKFKPLKQSSVFLRN